MGFLIKKPADEPGKALPAIVIGVFVAFGGILFGYAHPSSCICLLRFLLRPPPALYAIHTPPRALGLF